jgi:hypothetical protein
LQGNVQRDVHPMRCGSESRPLCLCENHKEHCLFSFAEFEVVEFLF